MDPAEAVVRGATGAASATSCEPAFPGVAAGTAFQFDGRLLCHAGYVDWYSSDVCSLGVLRSCEPGAFLGSNTFFFRDSVGSGPTQDPTVFQGSNTNSDLIGDPSSSPGQKPWSYQTGAPSLDDDLSEIYAALRVDPSDGHTWLILGCATVSTSGDKHVDFEFNQKGLRLDSVRGLVIGNGSVGGRTPGDLVVSHTWRDEPLRCLS